MPTPLDRLKELSELLRSMLFMEDAALQSALDEGFSESPPDWSNRLPSQYWANSLLADIRNSIELLDERLTPPDAAKTVHASVTMDPISIHVLTPEENEALGRGREAGQSNESV
jgi:hypothetical protein